MALRAFLLRSLPRVAGRLIAIAALLGILPYLLARFIGWPLPRHPTWHGLQQFLITPMSDDAIIKALACVAWLLWAIFALSVLIEVAAAIRGQPAPRLPVITPVQAFAAALVGATMLATLPAPQPGAHAFPLEHALAAHAIATAPPSPGQPSPELVTSLSVLPAVTLDARTTTSGTERDTATPRPRVYRVIEGDDLWKIAARFLGHGERWPEIFDLNAGKPQPDGLELTDPNYIQAGWVLLMPAAPAHAGGAHSGHGHPQPHRRTTGTLPSSRPSPSPRASRPLPTAKPSASTRPGAHRHGGPAVSLPSGAIIGLTLVSAAGVALVLSRLHRRRRREPVPVPGTAPAEPELSPVLRSIRQAHLAASRQQQDDNGDILSTTTPDDEEIPVRDAPSTEVVNVAVRDEDGEEIPLDLASVPGTGLDGPGAADAIRAIAITLLARRARDQAEVILWQDARQLFAAGGESGTPQVPGLAAFSDVDDSLGQLEAEIIHRRRLLDASGSDDLAAYRDANPDESLPTILVVAPAITPESARLASVLALGQDLGITAILIGPWPTGATCQVLADGVVTEVSMPELRHLDGAQMYQLTTAEAAEILSALAGASGSPPPAETGQPRLLPAPVADPHGAATGERERPAHIAILGPFQLSIGDEPVTKGLRRKAAELLSYLAIHRDGATSGAILDALWQDTPAERATPILHTATTNIRTILREATGASEAAFIVRATDRLRIDPHLVTTDLWQFQDALASAAHAESNDERYASLQAAADLWRGDIGPGIDSPWIDEYRETLRRDAVDTLARLAELSESGDPEQALAYLERAITIDRYQEALYRRIMRLQGDLGRPDAARRTYQLLESRLTELEAEPDELSAQLLSKILHSRRKKRLSVGSENQ